MSAVLRLVTVAGYRAHRLVQRVVGRPPGVHGVVLTPAGAVVLVRLRYAPGWQLPGGGRKRGERATDGLLRELREEIGLQRWTSTESLGGGQPAGEPPPAADAMFIVRGALYRSRWSLEIAEVRAFAPDALPADLARWTRVALECAGVASRA